MAGRLISVLSRLFSLLSTLTGGAGWLHSSVMESLSKQTKVLLHEITNGLTFAERASCEEYGSVEKNIQKQINIVMENCERLDYLVKKEPPSKREEAKLHVDKMKYDCKHLQQALQGIQLRRLV